MSCVYISYDRMNGFCDVGMDRVQSTSLLYYINMIWQAIWYNIFKKRVDKPPYTLKNI